MTLGQKLFAFDGRLRRRDYWLLSVGVYLALLFAISLLGVLTGADFDDPDDLVAALILFVVGLAALWPSMALTVKRCHDRNQSGWWSLLSLIPLIGGFWALLNLGIMDGSQGPNRFGPSPKGIAGETAELFA
jgi:uncharacterized membrane protein YhaH (DUF805 family)